MNTDTKRPAATRVKRPRINPKIRLVDDCPVRTWRGHTCHTDDKGKILWCLACGAVDR